MMNRLLVGTLASVAMLCLAFGRTHAVASSLAKPVLVPIADHVDPADDAHAGAAVAWPSRIPGRLLEVLYVYTNRTPTASRGGRSNGRDDLG